MSTEHEKRIHDELVSVGMTKYGLSKSATKELPKIIHQNEHIKGVVYGQVGSGNSAMLVATDKRILFVDKRTLYTSTDELSYDVVSGVKSTHAVPFTSVVLHTRVIDYTVRYVNSTCAKIFTRYIEKKRLEVNTNNQAIVGSTEEVSSPVQSFLFDEKALLFLKEQDLCVLSTVDRNGNVHGAVVYYVVDKNNIVYILTKSDTGKGKNIHAHGQVSLTIHEPDSLKTLQMQGFAEFETSQKTKDTVFAQIIKPRVYNGESRPSPVASLDAGAFVVIRIQPTMLSFHDYSKNQNS